MTDWRWLWEPAVYVGLLLAAGLFGIFAAAVTQRRRRP